MPPWIVKLLPLIMKTPWTRVVAVAAWLFTAGKSRLEKNTTKKERQELLKLLTKSKGRPSNLTDRETTRFRRLVYKAATGGFPA